MSHGSFKLHGLFSNFNDTYYLKIGLPSLLNNVYGVLKFQLSYQNCRANLVVLLISM